MGAFDKSARARLHARARNQVIWAEDRTVAREMAASEEAAAASIRAAAREALRSVALEYVPCEVPSTLPAGAAEPNFPCRTSSRPAVYPDSQSRSPLLPGAAIVERDQRRVPERTRRRHDLHIVKTFEAQISFMGVPGGFVEVLQLGIDFHCPLRRAAIRRCTHFETLNGNSTSRPKNIARHCPPQSPCTVHAPTTARSGLPVRLTYSEHLPGAKHHVR
jgi:hypothetical protein